MLLSTLITSDPEIAGGQSVFVGTRVPVESLFDYLEAGISLDEFLEEFPSVTREQVVQVLAAAHTLLAEQQSNTRYETAA